MLSAEVALDGADRAEAHIVELAQLSGTVHALLVARADAGKDRLARATNRGLTGDAQGGWAVEPVDEHTVAIVNRVVSVRGYSYPTGLASGTGSRAVPTTGFSGSHRADWPGMAPSQTLHPAWELEVLTGFTLPATLLGGIS